MERQVQAFDQLRQSQGILTEGTLRGQEET
jgi:hypothetical protein